MSIIVNIALWLTKCGLALATILLCIAVYVRGLQAATSNTKPFEYIVALGAAVLVLLIGWGLV